MSGDDDGGRGPLINAKIVILGSSGVGKTALSVRYCDGIFVPQSKSTIGASFLTKNVSLDNVRLKLQLWDTAGQERFRSLAPMYYRGASAALLVFDITNNDTFQRTQDWVTELRANSTDEILMVVVGNKADLSRHRAVPKEKGREFAEAINATYVETSAKDGEGILQLFTEICRKVISQRKQYLQHTPMMSGPTGQPDSNYIIQSEYDSQRSVRKKDEEVRLCCD